MLPHAHLPEKLSPVKTFQKKLAYTSSLTLLLSVFGLLPALAQTSSDIASVPTTTADGVDPTIASHGIPKSPASLQGRKVSLSRLQIQDRQDPLNFDWQFSPTSVCRGNYVPPLFNTEIPPKPYNESITTITYDTGELYAQGTSTLSGKVLIEQPQFRIFADEVEIFRNKAGDVTTAMAQGHVLLEQPNTRLSSNKATINLIDKSGVLENSYYRVYESHGRGYAREAKREPDGTINLFQASYTVCPPQDNTWRIKANEVSLNKEKGYGQAYHAKIYLKDWPVLYSPYLTFPLNDERKTGFLTPHYRGSNLRGEEFIFPFYVNLAPNYDFTLTSHYMTKRNDWEEGEFRFLFPGVEGTLYGAIVPHDPDWINYREQTIANNPRHLFPFDIRWKDLVDESDVRSAISFNATSIINRYTQANTVYNYVSDSNYLVDFEVPGLDSNNRQLLRQFTTIIERPVWSFAGRVINYQVLQPYESTISALPYQILPQAVAKAEIPNGEFGLDYALYSEATYFNSNDNPATNLPVTTGGRFDFSPAAALPLRNSYAYFIPRVEYRATQYNLSLGTEEQLIGKASSATRSIPLFDIDTGLLFDREFRLFNKDYTQTFEPRLFYLYVPYRNQNELPVFDSGIEDLQFDELFYVNRFSGRDRVGDANQLTYAVVSRLQEWESGIERVRLSLGQTVYFRDRLVTLCDTDTFPDCRAAENPNWNEPVSPIVGQLDYAVTSYWYTTAEMQWNIHDTGRLDQGGIWLSYRESNDYMLDFGYRYIWQGNPVGAPVGNSINNLEQLLTSFSYRFNSRWHALGGIQYDIINHMMIDTFGGLEYENCCWATRVGARRNLTINSSYQYEDQYDSSLYLQFVFKGLAAIGTSPGPLFVERIIGYDDLFGKRY